MCSRDETKKILKRFIFVSIEANTRRGLHYFKISGEKKRVQEKNREIKERNRKDVDSKDTTNDGEVSEEERKSVDDDDDEDKSEDQEKENQRRISKYAELLAETARTGMGQESVKILSLFKVHELKPSVEHFNAALAACREDHGLFTSVFKQMKEGEIEPNAVSHCIVNHVSEKKKDWSLAKSAAGKVAESVKKRGGKNRVKVFREMYDNVRTLGIPAPTLLMSGLIAELAHSGDWKESLELLSEARENKTKVSLAVVNIVAQSIEDAGLKNRAKEVQEMHRDMLCYDELHATQKVQVDDPTMDYYHKWQVGLDTRERKVVRMGEQPT